MYSVYKHTCPNGKVYIGITSRVPSARWQNGFGYRNNRPFFRDIVKYGWDNIDHSILHSDLPQEVAQELEIKYIHEYNSTNHNFGYNLVDGVSSSQNKSVEQYSIDGEYVYTFDSAAEASRYLHTSPSVISNAARKKGVSHGYIWKYSTDDSRIEIPLDIDRRVRSVYGKTFRRPTNQIPVSQYTFDGKLVRTYSSISEASKCTGIKQTCISGACKGENTSAKIIRRSAGGFIWKYAT